MWKRLLRALFRQAIGDRVREFVADLKSLDADLEVLRVRWSQEPLSQEFLQVLERATRLLRGVIRRLEELVS